LGIYIVLSAYKLKIKFASLAGYNKARRFYSKTIPAITVI